MQSQRAMELFLSFSCLGSVLHPIGCKKDQFISPVQAPYLPLVSVFVSRTKKLVYSSLYLITGL